MKDLRSTSKAFTQVARPLGHAGQTVATRPFAGTLQPLFAGWIRNHLGLTSSGWFRPVARYFQKPKNSFELVRWPGSSNREVGYMFSPGIRLTCFSANTTNSVFKSDGVRLFQTLTLSGEEIKRRVDGHSKSAATNPNPNITEGFSDKRVFTFLNTSVTPALLSTGLQKQLSSLFSTVFHNTKRITRSLANTLREKPGGVLQSTRPAKLSNSTEQPHIFERRSPSDAWLKTTRMNHRLDHSFLIANKRVELDGNEYAMPQSVTTVALNFVSSKVSETELLNRQVAHFISTPALTFARQQQETSEGIIRALRDLRTSKNEPRTVATPVMPSIEQLTSQVKSQLERELRIEKERRGL